MCDSDSYVPQILLAIDPGNEYSAFCFIDIETYKPLYFAKEKNEDAMAHIIEYIKGSETAVANVTNVAIEMVASYGMAVGASTFETCVQIGRFADRLEQLGLPVNFIYRKDEKMCICGQMRAKDSNIRQALIDRFAKFDFKNGKGTKTNPDWFFGFKADCWAAYSVGIVWIDAHKGLYELTK